MIRTATNVRPCCLMAVALKGCEVPRGVECIAERPDASRFWFTSYPVIRRDVDGKITGGMNVLVDITDRKNAQIDAIRTVRQLRLITENVDVGVTRSTTELRYALGEPYLRALVRPGA